MKISDTFLMEGYNIFDGNVNSYRETSSFGRKNEILTSSCTKTWFLYPGFNNNNNKNNNNNNSNNNNINSNSKNNNNNNSNNDNNNVMKLEKSQNNWT